MRFSGRQPQSGFSLIEIMAVVLILGLMTTGAVFIFSPGGPKKEFNGELEKFVTIARQISDFAIVTGEPMGLVLTPPLWSSQSLENPQWSYSWKRFVEEPAEGGRVHGAWQAIDGFEAQQMPETIELFVSLEDHEWEWQNVPPNETPVFVLYPSGEAEPFLFEIEVAHRSAEFESQHIVFNESGRLVWKEVWEEMEAMKDEY